MFVAKLLILLFLVVIANAQYRRLPLTRKPRPPEEPSTTISDILFHPKPEVIIVYPETKTNITPIKFNVATPYLTFKATTASTKDYFPGPPFPDYDQELEYVLKPPANSLLEPIPEQDIKLDSELEPDLGHELESIPEPVQEPKLEANQNPVPKQQPEIYPERPIYEPNETPDMPESTPKEKPDVLTFQTRPPHLSYFTTGLSPSPTSAHSPSNSETTTNSYQTLKPVIPAIQTTVITPTPHISSTTTSRNDNNDINNMCKEENAYYAISYECDTFVECTQYVAEKNICPDGLLFNPKAYWPDYPCAYPSEVKCGNRTIIQEPEPVGECPRRFGNYPSNSGDCGKYVVCHDGIALHMNCPNGLAFNPKSSGCDWPENVPNCKPKVFKDFACPAQPKDLHGRLSVKVYIYKYQNSCKEYIACNKGEPRLLRCDSGLSFDEISGRCINSKEVKNCEG